MIYVKSLDKLTENDLPQAGSKAVSLARVIKKGIFVPSGFVVLASAFDRFCRIAKIEEAIRKIVDGADPKNLAELSKRSAAIGELIAKHPIQNELVSQIDDAFDTLNAVYVAVRSSAAAEDTDLGAAAGQLASFIGIAQPDLNERIKNCWASAFSMGALAYFLKSGVDPQEIKPAVLVQKLVECEVSGVAFSRISDPAGKERLVIEAGLGLGEAVVSGGISPDRYELNIDPLYIIGKTISSQGRMMKRQGNAIAWQNVDQSVQATQKLADEQIKWLAQVVLKIEGIFASPRDVEWGFAGGRIAILQCRPIASAGRDSTKKLIWSNVNISEILPGIVLPLVSSTMMFVIEPALRSVLPVKKNETLLRDFKGRLYFNATAIARVLAEKTRIKNFPVELLFGGQGLGQLKMTVAGKLALASYGAKVFVHSTAAFWKFKAKIGEAVKMAREYERRARAAAELPDLLALESEIAVYSRSVMVGASTLLYPLTYYFIFIHLCRKWLNDRTGEKANSFLASGSRQVEMLESFEKLWDLSRSIKNDRNLANRFLKAGTISKAEAALAQSRGASAAWQVYLEKYGHRCAGEADFSRPRWKEDASFLINTLKLYLKTSEEADPTSKIEKLAKKKEMLLWETKRLLPGWKFLIFKKTLASAEGVQILREQIKSALIRLLFPLRLVYLKIGSIIMVKGYFRNASDIFFLTREEIDAVRRGTLAVDPDLANLVARRKNSHKRAAGLKMPAVIEGEPDFPDISMEAASSQAKVETLQGLAVSSGIAQGVARVVERIDDIWKIRPGEILVCDHLDPGWTPVFVVVKGVVSNTGGLLSHASIVAREYGLPVVANVSRATVLIRDGQRIMVDGNRGTVKIIDECVKD
jgi:pyruvate,water dikinase